MTEVAEPEDCEEDEIARYKPVYCFVMNNRCIEEHNTFLKGPMRG